VRRNNNNDGDVDDKITGREKKRSGAQGDHHPGQNSLAVVWHNYVYCVPYL